MKFPNGGYNTQFTTDGESGTVLGVEVTSAGSDSEQLSPMLDQAEERYGKNPQEVLVDGGFATKATVTDAAKDHGCTVYAPLKEEAKQLAAGGNPYAKKKGDSPAAAAWRTRMATSAAKQIYKLRADGRVGKRPLPQPQLSADAGS